MHTLIGVFIWIIVASSLRLLGLSGQGSIGHAAFMAIGAYTSAILAKFLGWSPWITMPIGVLITVVDRFPGGSALHAGEGNLFHHGQPVLWDRCAGHQPGLQQIHRRLLGHYLHSTLVRLQQDPLLLFLPGVDGDLPGHHVPSGAQPDRSDLEGSGPIVLGGIEYRNQ